MEQAEFNRLCQKPGGEGALWRLVRSWDPDKLTRWLQEEKRKGLTPEQAIAIVAEVMSGMALILANALGGDKKGAILGQQGLCTMMRQAVEYKLTQVGGAHVISPIKQ